MYISITDLILCPQAFKIHAGSTHVYARCDVFIGECDPLWKYYTAIIRPWDSILIRENFLRHEVDGGKDKGN